MAFDIDITATHLVVRSSGWDRLWSFSREVSVPLAAVIVARVVPICVARSELGWRMGGTAIPGRVIAGWFSWRRRPGYRQWWATFRDPQVLMIDTTMKRPARLVLQTLRRDELAAALSADVAQRVAANPESSGRHPR
jgi:hypothetical protein